MIDFSSNIGKLRLRCGDIGDLVFLPDEVYYATIQENNGNLPNAARTICQYLLALFAVGASHKKMVQLEIWNKERFDAYRKFLLDAVSNPAFMNYSPIAYGAVTSDETNPLLQFQTDWNNNWTGLTQSQEMHLTAIPNEFGLGFGTGNI